MKTLSIREARQALSRLDQILETEGEITITRRGKAVARVVHLGKKAPVPSHKDLRERMPRMKKASETLIREDRNSR